MKVSELASERMSVWKAEAGIADVYEKGRACISDSTCARKSRLESKRVNVWEGDYMTKSMILGERGSYLNTIKKLESD